MKLPVHLYTGAQVRELDLMAMEGHGLAGGVLMERAGAAAFLALRLCWPRARRIAVVCGPGNNGGDGYVLARLAWEAGLEPVVLALGDGDRLQGDARAARERYEEAGGPAHTFTPELLAPAELMVDALFGTGLERPVTGPWREAIEAMNRHPAPVLAVDIPSGLHADTGAVLGAAVQAGATISFIGLKLGLFTGAAPDRVGRLFFDDLAVPSQIYAGVSPVAERLDADSSLAGVLKHRPRGSHKGRYGHVLVIGGSPGLGGAARLAGEAAARAGAGLVSVAAHPVHAVQISGARPELMSHPVESKARLKPLLARATILALGPGLGQGEWGRRLLGTVLEQDRPMVVDADALNLLAQDPVRRGDWILTPHPGEAARLLDCSAAEVQADRPAAVREITARYGGVCILKGAGTLVCGAGGLGLCDAGNPGLATGGAGDVLTGLVAALMAQGLAPEAAARAGVWVHASAADVVAATRGEAGLMASDLLPQIPLQLERLLP